MYKKYATATLTTRALMLPVDLFEISALVKGVSTDPHTGMSLLDRFSRMSLKEEEKITLYREDIIKEPVEGEPKSLLQAYWSGFTVNQGVLHITPDDLIYDEIASKPWIQPNDIIIDVYEFTNLQDFAAMIPYAGATWGDHDKRVIEMQTTLELATRAHQRAQNYSIITCSHVSELYTYRRQAATFHIATAQVDPHAVLKLKREVCSKLEQKQVEKLLPKLFEGELAGKLSKHLKESTVEIPIYDENKDWMGDLRSRDNHFRSADDVFTRVTMPLSQHFAELDSKGYREVKHANSLSDVQETPLNVFAVSLLSVRPIPCETCLIVNKRIVPVFFSTESDDSVLNPFESLSYILYRGEGASLFSFDFRVHRLKSQPFEYRDRNAGSYIVVGLKGIAVYTLAGLQKYNISYAKINEEALTVLASHLSA